MFFYKKNLCQNKLKKEWFETLVNYVDKILLF